MPHRTAIEIRDRLTTYALWFCALLLIFSIVFAFVNGVHTVKALGFWAAAAFSIVVAPRKWLVVGTAMALVLMRAVVGLFLTGSPWLLLLIAGLLLAFKFIARPLAAEGVPGTHATGEIDVIDVLAFAVCFLFVLLIIGALSKL